MSRGPNPGSREAGALGCSCPVNANYMGEREPDGGWRIRAACSVHGDVVESSSLEIIAVPEEKGLEQYIWHAVGAGLVVVGAAIAVWWWRRERG